MNLLLKPTSPQNNLFLSAATERRFSVRALFRFLHASYRQSGFISLWRGNTATLTRIFPYAAIQYSSHERYKHAFGIDLPDLSHM